MPYRNDLGPEYDFLYQSHMRGPAADVPFLYGAVQQQPRQYTNIPAVDAMIAMAAPVVGSMMGMQNPMLLPQLGPGVSPFEAQYAQRVNQPMYQAAQDQQFYQLGQMFGGTAGRIATNAGLHNVFGMSSDDFQRNIVNMASGELGRNVVSQLLNNQTAETIMGGNALRAMDDIVGARHMLGRIPGEVLDPLDMRGQGAMMQHASSVSKSLMRRVYGDEYGSGMGLTPNMDYTRGFKVDDLSRMGMYMAQRGVESMQGVDVPAGVKTGAIGNMARVMESLSDLVGTDDLGTLFTSLERLTQMQWPDMDPQALEQSFRRMNATAQALGVSGQVMVETVGAMQQNVQASMGISGAEAALGVTGGGYGTAGGQFMAETVLAIAHANPNKSRQQIMAEQTALLDINMRSAKGKDLQLVNYLAQQGMVSGDLMGMLSGAIDAGNTPEQRAIVDEAYRQAFGSEIRGRELAQNQNFMRQVQQDTNEGTAANVLNQFQRLTASEMSERFRDRMYQDLGTRTRDVGRMSGTTTRLARSERAILDHNTAVSELRAMGREEDAQLLEDRYQNELERNGEEAASRLSRRMLGAMGLNEGERQRISGAQTRALTAAEAGNVLETQDERVEMAGTNAKIRALRATNGLTGTEASQYRSKMQRANQLMREGKVDEAMAIRREAETGMEDAVRSNLGDGAGKAIEFAERRAGEAQIKTRQAQAGARETLMGTQRAEEALDQGIGSGVAIADSQRLAGIYQKVASGEMSQEDAQRELNRLSTIAGTDRKNAQRIISEGPNQQDIQEAKNVAGGMDVRYKQVAAERQGGAAAGTQDAVQDLINAQSTREQAKAYAATNAEIMKVTDDMSQDLRRNFGQLLVGWAEGDTSAARLFGLQEDSSVPLTAKERKQRQKFLSSKEAKSAEELSKAMKGEHDIQTEAGKRMYDIQYSDAYREAGLTAQAVQVEADFTEETIARNNLRSSLSGVEGISEKDREELMEKSKTMSYKEFHDELKGLGVSSEDRLAIGKKYARHRDVRGKGAKALEDLRAAEKQAAIENPELAGKLDMADDLEAAAKQKGESLSRMRGQGEKMAELSEKTKDQRTALAAQEIAAGRRRQQVEKSLTSIEGGMTGEFLSEFDLSEMSGKDRKGAIKLIAQMSGESGKGHAGWFKGSDTKAAQKILDQWSTDPEAFQAATSGMDAKQLSALKRMGEIYKDKTGPGGGKAASSGEKGGTFRLEGELTLRNSKGMTLGTADGSMQGQM